MDVLLLGSAVASPLFVIHHEQSKRINALSISLGLSFCLFALSVLEVTPSSWLILLDNRVNESTDDGSLRTGTNYFSVSFMYFLVLSALAVYILFVCPSIAGALVMDRLWGCCSSGKVLDIFCCLSWERPWYMKLLAFLIVSIYKLFTYFASALVSITIFMMHNLMPRPDSSSTGLTKRDSNKGKSLPMTKSDVDDNLPTDSRQIQFKRGGILLFGSLTGIAATIGGLYFLSPYIIQPKSNGNVLCTALSWMCAIGIVLSAILNGFGSVSMPHSFLAGLFLEPIKAEMISKATVDIQKTQESLKARRDQLKAMSFGNIKSTTPPGGINSNSTSFWGARRQVKKTFSGMGDEVQARKRKIMEEIAFLETLVEEMKEDIEDMKYTQAMEAASRTTMGRIKAWMGVLFSLVLVLRLYFAAVGILEHWHMENDTSSNPPSTRRDPVTTTLLWLVGHHMVRENKYDALSQFLSLLLTALLSFSQVRTFLRTVATLHRRLNHLFCPTVNSGRFVTPIRNDASSLSDGQQLFQTRTGVYLHILSALMGCYFLACVVLTKMMIPWKYRSSFSDALGGFDAFVIAPEKINVMFASSAIVSATVLAMLLGIQKQNSCRHNVSWMEELNPVGSREFDP